MGVKVDDIKKFSSRVTVEKTLRSTFITIINDKNFISHPVCDHGNVLRILNEKLIQIFHNSMGKN